MTEKDRKTPAPVEAPVRVGVRGIDYVWPSIAPGVLDPSQVGQPGISGPAAA